MEMPCDERWLDICPTQFVPHEPRRRALPDRVLDIYDRCHQRDETKIGFNHGEKRADPAAITGAEHTEPLAAAFAQYCHQFPHLDYALTQPFCIADKMGSDRELAVPIAARNARVMIRQVHEARIPAELIKARSVTAISDV